ncbi:hypothetical protein LU632_05670 [Erwinia tracheiphila]|nr:hypothetical protein [Erwinia tracheiphila]UIA93062.1 hypothetical protein LU632_05670 [Erwinia tracheiphila]
MTTFASCLERLWHRTTRNPDSLTEEDLGELWQQALSALDTLLSAAERWQ